MTALEDADFRRELQLQSMIIEGHHNTKHLDAVATEAESIACELRRRATAAASEYVEMQRMYLDAYGGRQRT